MGFGGPGHALGQAGVDGIAAYELHLRYHVRAQKWIGFPYAFQTIGSAMAVRAWVRQAGRHEPPPRRGGFLFPPENQLARPDQRVIHRHRVPLTKAVWASSVWHRQGRWRLHRVRATNRIHCRPTAMWRWLILQANPLWESGRFSEPPPNVLKRFWGRHSSSRLPRRYATTQAERRHSCTTFFRWFNAFRLMKYLNFARMKNTGPFLSRLPPEHCSMKWESL